MDRGRRLPIDGRPPARAILRAGLAVLVAALLPLPASARPPAGFVRGQVVSYQTGRPVGGAEVFLPAYGARATSRADGTFAFSQPMPTERAYRTIEARVRAPGFGTWTVTGLPLYPDDALVLHAELRREAFRHRVRGPDERGPNRRAAPLAPSGGNTCSGWDYQLVPPPTIRVHLSAEGRSRAYDFVFYVRHVLPSEWIPSWDADALGAGAIATRSYAAYRAMTGHAWSGGPDCADVIDTVSDQIFDPTYSHAATDQAVWATFGSILYRDGGLFSTQYFAGSHDQPCAPITQGTFAGRMSQWGTQNCAEQGMRWPGITTTFYQRSYWNYLGNLMLNPSFSSPALYAYRASPNTVAERTRGTGYEGGWFLAQRPREPRTNSTVWEERPFRGGPNTAYRAAVALLCPEENPRGCRVTVRVVAFRENGSEVTRETIVRVPRTGRWQLVTFEPPPHGIDHVRIRLSVVTIRRIGTDAWFLQAPFGGP